VTFQIKDFLSIVASQINHARSVTEKITDFEPGSVSRTLMEAPAVEIEELYLQMFLGLRDAIPVSTFRSFGFDLLPVRWANGFVSITADVALPEPITIPSGSVFTAVDGRTYLSTSEVVWAAGSTFVRVPVQASVAGLAGNIAAGLITSSTLLSTGYTVSNPLIDNGREVETDTEREARFSEYVASLSRGTLVSCEYAAKQASVVGLDGGITEYVARIGVSETPGIIRIYIYSSQGVPSAAILLDGQRRIDGYTDELTGVVTPGYRPAGVRCDVLAMVEREIPLSISVGMYTGYSLTAAVQQAITDIYATTISSVQPGTTLFLKSLTESLLAVDGVRTIVPATSDNIVCGVNEALTPGFLSISNL
jgi:Baseplate J-like protein